MMMFGGVYHLGGGLQRFFLSYEGTNHASCWGNYIREYIGWHSCFQKKHVALAGEEVFGPQKHTENTKPQEVWLED